MAPFNPPIGILIKSTGTSFLLVLAGLRLWIPRFGIQLGRRIHERTLLLADDRQARIFKIRGMGRVGM